MATSSSSAPDTLALTRQFLAERLDVAPERVVPEAVLADLGVDSLMFAEMLFDFEDRTHTSIDIQSGEHIPKTVGELVEMIDAHLQTAAPAQTPSAG